jgi:hypothetical protein
MEQTTQLPGILRYRRETVRAGFPRGLEAGERILRVRTGSTREERASCDSSLQSAHRPWNCWDPRACVGPQEVVLPVTHHFLNFEGRDGVDAHATGGDRNAGVDRGRDRCEK